MSRRLKASSASVEAKGSPPTRSLIRLRPNLWTRYLSSGRTVLAAGDDGVVGDHHDQGLFVYETRLLSRYRYLIDGAAPHAVSVSNVSQHTWLGYFLADIGRVPIADAAQEAVELRLSRYVGAGVHEDVDLTNYAR